MAQEFLSRTGYRPVQTADLTSASISDFTEAAQDAIATTLTDTATIDLSYDDSLAQITADLKNTTVVAGTYGTASQVSTFTVDAQGRLTAASNTIISITASQVSDFNEVAQDAVGNILVDSADVDFTYNDSLNTITAVLTTTGVSAASYGSASSVATFTVDSKGRLSAAASTAISITASQVSDFNAAVKTYADTLYVPLVPTFTSADLAITSAGALTVAHGLGAIPNFIHVYLRNTTTNQGYAVGDIIIISCHAGSGTNTGVSIVPDATNLNIRYGSSASVFEYLNKTTGVRNALTNGSWAMFIVAKRI